MGQLFDKRRKRRKTKTKMEEGMTEAHDLQNLFPGRKRLFEHIRSGNNRPHRWVKTWPNLSAKPAAHLCVMP